MTGPPPSPDQRIPVPSGCRWCGIERHEHVQRWAVPVGWHRWEEPTIEQRKERFLARRRTRGTGSEDAKSCSAA